MTLFDRTPRYVITLQNIPDRLASAKQQPNFRIFQAFDMKHYTISPTEKTRAIMSGSELGCLFSHTAIVKFAQAQQFTAVMISEDDATFTNPFNPPDPPPDWDFVYFTSTVHNDTHLPRVPVPNHPGYYESVPTMGATAYAIRSTAYQLLLDEALVPTPIPIDVAMARLVNSHKLRAYTTYPFHAYQGRIRSYITGSRVLTPLAHLLQHFKKGTP